jgi:hypothetical protein
VSEISTDGFGGVMGVSVPGVVSSGVVSAGVVCAGVVLAGVVSAGVVFSVFEAKLQDANSVVSIATVRRSTKIF